MRIHLLMIALPCLLLAKAYGQNAIVGDFSSGWGGGSCPTGNTNFTYFSAGAGSSYGSTALAVGSTGTKYWRLGVDWGGTTGQFTITPGSNTAVSPNTTYTLSGTCTTNGAMQYNVGSTANRYYFKTQDASATPSYKMVFFELGGTAVTVSSVAKNLATVNNGQGVAVTATLSAAFPSGQAAYLRYSIDNWSNSVVLSMTGSGTSYTATIPASANTTGTTVKYYVFTSGTTNVAANGSNADFYTINYNNNGGVNYSYTVVNTGQTYYWVGGASGALSTSTSTVLSTSKGGAAISVTLGTADKVIFDGTNLGGGATVSASFSSGGASVAFGQLVITGNATVTYSPTSSGRNVTLYGAAGTDLDVQSGSTLVHGGSNHNITLAAGATASISGVHQIGTGSGSPFQLIGTDAGAITYNYGAVCYENISSGMLPFGASTTGSVVFASGSTFIEIKGGDPFGGDGYNNIVFQTGSTYEYNGTNASYCAFLQSNTDRTYANVVMNISASGTYSIIATHNATVDTLSLKATAAATTTNLDFGNNSKTLTIKGNLNNFTTNKLLIFSPNASGTGTINFSGTVNQYINNNASATTSSISFGQTSAGRNMVINVNAGSNVFMGSSGNMWLTCQSATGNTSFYVKSGGTLDCGTSVISFVTGGNFILQSGGTLKMGSTEGITLAGTALGNIQTQVRTFDVAANYEYNGTTGNQNSGTALPATVNNLTINNSGSTVKLTNTSGSTVNGILYLTNGSFDLNDKTISLNNPTANGIVLTGARSVTNSGVATGYINVINTNCTVSGSATPSVAFGTGVTVKTVKGVDFGSLMSTINGTFQIDNGGFNTGNAPYYGNGSTLFYNTGGTFNRSIEWGNFSGSPGYPWHVTVENSTTLNLGTSTPPNLEMAGNLTIGKTSSSNIVSLNALAMPLKVLGNIVIGDPATTLNRLTLSTVSGGDLELSGNFTRYLTTNYFDNSALDATPHPRAVYFKGTSASSITATVQKFHKILMQKSGAGDLTLNCAVFIENNADFTTGKINTSSSNLLTFENAATVSGTPGTASYINGPAAKQMNAGYGSEFVFPLGKAAGSPIYNPAGIVPGSIGNATTFTAEYFVNPNQAQGIMGMNVLGIQNQGYWDISNSVPLSNTARVKVYYTNPGSGNWIYYNGSASSPYYTAATDPLYYCNVAVVRRDAVTTSWSFTSSFGNFNTTDPESRSYANNGFIYSHDPTLAFTRFSIGYSINSILPINLLSFTGKIQGADGRLDWRIANSTDLAGFELQYSRDGRQFNRLADIAGSQATVYGYTHQALPAGANFYRLLIKEKNGGSTYSATVLLSTAKTGTIVIGLQQNPVKDQAVVLVYSAGNQPVQATVTDQLGRRLSNTTGRLTAGNNQLTVPLPQVSKGIYYLGIRTADGVQQTLRLVKNE